MADDYPFAGCCPHGFNAHTRDHCTACDCAKQIRRYNLGTQPPAASEAETTDIGNLRECSLCWGLILEESRERHLAFHEKTIETTHRLLMMITHADRTHTHEPN